MKLIRFRKSFAFLFVAASCSIVGFAQRAKPPQPVKKAVIFAVLGDGGLLEPIAYVSKGKLEATVNGSDSPSLLAAFNRNYYKPGTSYRLIFGGGDAGSVSVKSANPQSDCSKNIAISVTKAAKTPLKGLVMGLATNAPGKISTSVRRKPTAEEKDEIEALVLEEYAKQKLTPKVLRYHNLTALDIENDGKVEFVGSYWMEIDRLTRGLLFFIAGKGSNDKYSVGYREYKEIDQSKVMSGEIKSIDEGVGHELLLDAFDFDGDGTSNIFTYIQSFEGAGFAAYRKSGGKWSKTYEGSNYHCGY
ncbi:MAG: hypothetical protein WKF34_12460 [Pyrinomonadaceae bacterium]